MKDLDSPPLAGNGLHDWILDYTRREILRGRATEDVRFSCYELTRANGRPEAILEKEIDDAIDGALDWLAEHPTAAYRGPSAKLRPPNRSWEYRDFVSDGIHRPPKSNRWKAPVDAGLISWILRRNFGPLKPKDSYNLADLYGSYNFALCLAKEVYLPQARKLSYWIENERALSIAQWMVPNPCLRCGDGGYVKTDLNAAERLWLIIEFDKGTLEEQAKLLQWLSRAHAEWELSLIVYSGGKSLHGWFSSVGKLEHREIVRFFRVAASLGCDVAMRSSVQYTRVPLGWNAKTKRQQSIVHWNDEAISEHNFKLRKMLTDRNE